MTPQELRKSILLLAFKGKLVEQNIDENSYSLLSDVIKHGCSNKKYLSFKNDLAPYDIPENWSWCMFHNIVSLENGEKERGVKLPYLEAKYLRGNSEAKYLECGEVVKPGTKVILVDGENSGEVFFIKEKGYMGSTFKILNIFGSINEKYVLYFMKLHQDDYRNNKKGAAIPHLNKNIFFEMPFPLAPLEEQKRIVKKIEELLPLIDRYEKAWNKLETFNKKFPMDMKNSLLQYALEGKLSSHQESDSNSKDYLLTIRERRNKLIKQGIVKNDKRLENDEMVDYSDYFEVPENWCWTHLGNLLYKLTDGTHKTPKYTESGVKFVSVKDMSGGVLDLTNTKFISIEEHNELFARCNPVRGDMLLSKVGTTGVPAIIDTDEPFSLFVSVALLKYDHDFIDEKFFYYLLMSPIVKKQANENTRGVGNQNWVLDAIAKTIVPLPPIEEQRRIVTKLEELLPLCRKLIK